MTENICMEASMVGVHKIPRKKASKVENWLKNNSNLHPRNLNHIGIPRDEIFRQFVQWWFSSNMNNKLLNMAVMPPPPHYQQTHLQQQQELINISHLMNQNHPNIHPGFVVCLYII